MSATDYYRDLVRPLVAGRRWILSGDVLAGQTGAVKMLRDLGSDRCLVIAGSRGTGAAPDEDVADCLVLGIEAPDIIQGIRGLEAALASPSRDLLDALARFDPARECRVVSPPFGSWQELDGRAVYGARRPHWGALEDKVLADALWDEAGVERAPSAVVAASGDEASRVARQLDAGSGTVWSGDSRDGFNGGAVFVRWIRSAADGDEARGFFASRCDRVRIMPFLEGIPCSIHGVVFEDCVATFRPVEMVTLRRPDSSSLLYAGAACFYDPPAADREAMREVARKVGRRLRERVAYRGAFTVDGVMTSDGFRPTELNPRAGAGLGPLQAGLPDLPLGIVLRALIEGEALDYKPELLEATIVSSADAKRGGGAWTVTPAMPSSTDDQPLVRRHEGYRAMTEGETPDATLTLGPSAVGGFVRFTPDPHRTEAGPSIAPLAVSAFRICDKRFGTGLGSLEPAKSVR
jgi:hypothetical protein